MLETIVQSHERLSHYLSAYRSAFKNRPQYRHFQAYGVGLMIHLGSRNLASLTRAIPSGKSACSLYRLVINRVIGQKKWRFLISTDCSLTPRTIIGHYLVRWEVENFYRVARQSLGWADYQMRDLFAIERHVQLMLLAHAYLEMAREDVLAGSAESDAHVTLGVFSANIKLYPGVLRSLRSLT